MQQFSGEICAIVGMMKDKNCDGFLEQVLKFCKSVITVTVKENPRTATAEELAEISKKYCNNVTVAHNYQTAIDLVAKQSGGTAPVFVFGSLVAIFPFK